MASANTGLCFPEFLIVAAQQIFIDLVADRDQADVFASLDLRQFLRIRKV